MRATMLAALIICATSFPSSRAHGTQTEFGFTATLTSVQDRDGLLDPGVGVGMQISGSYVFDPDITFDENPGASVAEYFVPFLSSQLVIGSDVITSFETGRQSVEESEIRILDDCPPSECGSGPEDEYNPVYSSRDNVLNGSTIIEDLVWKFRLRASSPSNAITSTELPVVPPDVSLFDLSRSLEIAFSEPGPNGRHANLQGRIDSLFLVPEPSTALLVGVGLLGLAARGRRQTTSLRGREFPYESRDVELAERV